ncbi:hypothetical protein [Crocosphaera sp. XPORK-15E]|uniref:hypothetical protein n=1 Tax=Crocosphaera sp. XPORK-15E TaxID=3110247 RepID=UPI002B2096B2|nr:hypothetical protein [Crocosphaera sp. XPORK-15E]MEA5534223.1 hypothetical protein [Crocosphaera sp. XPORK-15E]
MNIKEFEDLIRTEITNIIQEIIVKDEFLTHIAAKSRAGKDISPKFRRTPTNQLQVNRSDEPTYRTRDEFIDLLMEKIQEGLIRQLEKAQKKLSQMDEKKELLKNRNAESEKIIEEKIQ